MKSRRRDFMPIKGLINGLVRRLRPPAEDSQACVAETWARTVGEEFLAIARVSGISENTVRIDVAGAAARAELESFYRARFLQALRDAGMRHLTRVYFHVRDV
ncbi:MAG TPA: DciA family protein [Planctomycetota bacterium]|jgi:hypothetical protein|nr:DUF721 domain-containing protein [Planctomycetota bacterium]HNV47421.1 DciA family protein [Spirochaetota bacterium]NMD34653.1 DUF721 domain-containing protein [Planctomycetota bacterium]HNU27290.1 DciA family protein [Planctomycetota bacterium]HOE31525.1 DciA family protein [Planctomycetota bacterium]